MKPVAQVADERQAVPASTLQALVGGKSVDLPLDVEQGIHPFDGFKCHRRDRRGVLSALGIHGDVGQHEELAPRVRPAERLRQRTGIAINLEQWIVAAIGIRLKNAGEGLQVTFGVLLSPVSRSIIECRRRRLPAERPVIPDIGPYPAGIGLAPR
ncbi:hypothetical protein D9M70_510160 [compost metagenome]